MDSVDLSVDFSNNVYLKRRFFFFFLKGLKAQDFSGRGWFDRLGEIILLGIVFIWIQPLLCTILECKWELDNDDKNDDTMMIRWLALG